MNNELHNIYDSYRVIVCLSRLPLRYNIEPYAVLTVTPPPTSTAQSFENFNLVKYIESSVGLLKE